MARSQKTRVLHEHVPAPPPPADGSCNEWCTGMHLIETECVDHPLFRWFSVDDLMVAGAVRRPGHPLLYLYKHRDTRRYLNVDEAGVAWRYVPPPADRLGFAEDHGSYERLPSLGAALDLLHLWELPVMRCAPFEDVWQAYAAAPSTHVMAFTIDDDEDLDDDDLDDNELDDDLDDEDLGGEWEDEPMSP